MDEWPVCVRSGRQAVWSAGHHWGQLAAHTWSAGGARAIHEYFYILAARALAISSALVSVHIMATCKWRQLGAINFLSSQQPTTPSTN